MDANVWKWVLFCSLVVLNIFDAGTTIIVTDIAGTDAEINPLIRIILDSFGPYGLIAIKFFVIAFSAKWIYQTPLWIWGVLNLFYLVIVLHNAYIVFSIIL